MRRGACDCVADGSVRACSDPVGRQPHPYREPRGRQRGHLSPPRRRRRRAVASAGVSSTAPPSPRPRPMGGRQVYVVGGGNSAGQAARAPVASYAEHVTILVRRADLRRDMSEYLIADSSRSRRNVEIVYNVTVVGGGGRRFAEPRSRSRTWTPATHRGRAGRGPVRAHRVAVLIPVGSIRWPVGRLRLRRGHGADVDRTALLGMAAQRAPLLLETSVPGVFAVGDACATGQSSGWATAVGDGAAVLVEVMHGYLGGGTRPGPDRRCDDADDAHAQDARAGSGRGALRSSLLMRRLLYVAAALVFLAGIPLFVFPERTDRLLRVDGRFARMTAVFLGSSVLVGLGLELASAARSASLAHGHDCRSRRLRVHVAHLRHLARASPQAARPPLRPLRALRARRARPARRARAAGRARLGTCHRVHVVGGVHRRPDHHGRRLGRAAPSVDRGAAAEPVAHRLSGHRSP